MQNVFEKINMHYVEEIDPYPLVKAGIDGMLEKLDPYTVFIEEDGERRLRMITTGKYGGLGMEIGIKDGKVTIISPMDNSPAIRSGVQAGDVITQIDGKKIDDLNIDIPIVLLSIYNNRLNTIMLQDRSYAMIIYLIRIFMIKCHGDKTARFLSLCHESPL